MGKKKQKPPSFESSLQELQQIVQELEEGQLGLEESMQRFENGVKLLRHCYRVLEEAEQKIEILTGRESDDGTPLTEPFDASATLDAGTESAGRRRKNRSTDAESSGDTEASGQRADPRRELF